MAGRHGADQNVFIPGKAPKQSQVLKGPRYVMPGHGFARDPGQVGPTDQDAPRSASY